VSWAEGGIEIELELDETRRSFTVSEALADGAEEQKGDGDRAPASVSILAMTYAVA
jgi:hypothetical protein